MSLQPFRRIIIDIVREGRVVFEDDCAALDVELRIKAAMEIELLLSKSVPHARSRFAIATRATGLRERRIVSRKAPSVAETIQRLFFWRSRLRNAEVSHRIGIDHEPGGDRSHVAGRHGQPDAIRAPIDVAQRVIAVRTTRGSLHHGIRGGIDERHRRARELLFPLGDQLVAIGIDPHGARDGVGDARRRAETLQHASQHAASEQAKTLHSILPVIVYRHDAPSRVDCPLSRRLCDIAFSLAIYLNVCASSIEMEEKCQKIVARG